MIVVSAVLVVVLGAACWVGIRAFIAKTELEALLPLAGSLQTAAADRDLDSAALIADEFAAHAEQAAGLTGDPLWRAAELLPWLGANLAAVRVVSTELDSLGTDALPALLDLARTLSSGESPTGGIDVAALAAAQRPLQRAADSLDAASTELARIDAGALIPQLSTAVEQAATAVGPAGATVASLAKASAVVPPLLGADEPQTLLLMVQNNAELRTGGGITGTFVELTAQNGAISFGTQADSSSFAHSVEPILAVPASLTTLYGDVVGRFVQDTSMPADFSLTAELASEWWRAHSGTTPDAVVSIDPIVLKALISVTGPITLPDGSILTADDLVQRVLVDPYLTLSSEEQSEFFSVVTQSVFAALFAGHVDPLAWLGALAVPAEQGRISIWSSDATVQQTLSTTPLGGPAARQALAGDNAYAVYFNDATGGKLNGFMRTTIASGTSGCRADGRREVVVAVTLSSDVPADVEQRFPMSMTGGGLWGVAVGDIGMVVSVSAPEGAYFGGVRKDGELMVSANVEDGPYAVSAARVNLQPGEVNTMEFRFIEGAENALDPVILHTPLLTDPELKAADITCN